MSNYFLFYIIFLFWSNLEYTILFSDCSLIPAGVHIKGPNLTAEEVEPRSLSKDPSTARVATSTVLDMVWMLCLKIRWILVWCRLTQKSNLCRFIYLVKIENRIMIHVKRIIIFKKYYSLFRRAGEPDSVHFFRGSWEPWKRDWLPNTDFQFHRNQIDTSTKMTLV